MKIFVFRHGETDWNAQHRIQGRENIPLNARGRAQAKAMARAVEGKHFPAFILTSDLDRAIETGQILAAQLGIRTLIVEPNLTECSFGQLSGMVVDNIFDADCEDKESVDSAAERFLGVLDRYVTGTDRDFAVVSHGGTINAALYRISGGQLGTGLTSLRNADVSILAYDKGAYQILQYDLIADDFHEQSPSLL